MAVNLAFTVFQSLLLKPKAWNAKEKWRLTSPLAVSSRHQEDIEQLRSVGALCDGYAFKRVEFGAWGDTHNEDIVT